MAGTLYVVATPIGNLQDISLRAIETLRSVDLIACEDTRQTGKLLARHAIRRPMTSLHEYNERQRVPSLLRELAAGRSIALVSDSGTPLISDPGWRVVHEAIGAGVPVRWIPGPAALIGGLVVSGLPTDRFTFEGFLPAKPGARRKRLEALRGESRTVVCYEAPQRLLKTLRELRALFGDIPVTCARELTKIFEEARRGPIGEVLAHFEQHPPRGECTVVFRTTTRAATGGLNRNELE